eukprot:12563523-Ditylum_brightwellii.AAC.1
MGNHQQRVLSEMDMKFQHPSGIDQLANDAAHATSVRSQRLISRHVATMAGFAVTYSAKWHQTVSTSSTEAQPPQPGWPSTSE